MKRNEIAPLGNLRIGDRFHIQGDKTKSVHEVVSHKCKKPYVAYQYVSGQKYLYHKKATAFTLVIFLRHTIPAPGEEWMLNDLQVGDVFYMFGDVITEYQVVSRRTPENDVLIRYLNDLSITQPFEHCDVAVTFVRKEEEVKA